MWIKAAEGAQEALVAANSDRFYRPKYLGPSGWVGVRLVEPIDWSEIRWLLVEGYRLVAPKRALTALDQNSSAPGPRRKSSRKSGTRPRADGHGPGRTR